MLPAKTLAIIINYKSAYLTLQAVQSVLNSSSLGPIHIAVIDNSEDEEEVKRLKFGLPPAITLRVNAKNIGFGRACNQAFEQFPGEFILLINPDAKLLPGCLVCLQRLLSAKKNVGAVSPRVYWDERLSYLLPPSYPPSLFLFEPILDKFGPHSLINRFFSNIWRHYSIKFWRSEQPAKMSNLSGGVVLLKRAAIIKSHGLFDPRFFLYFEDTDLFIRLKKGGYTLFMEPKAKAIHYYNQCGKGSGIDKMSIFTASYKMFIQKNIMGLKFPARKTMDYRAPPIKTKNAILPDSVLTSPFMLEIPTSLQKGWLFEFSPNPNFIPSAGRFGKGPVMDFPIDCWTMLAPGRYYGRLGGTKKLGKPVKVVSWVVC